MIMDEIKLVVVTISNNNNSKLLIIIKIIIFIHVDTISKNANSQPEG